jgi:O-acetyl-ADP-ribose deacetylase (regulator of RNase III)
MTQVPKSTNVAVQIVAGDIANIHADALIAPINSGQAWHGAIDGVIQRCAGWQFHQQAAAAAPLHDQQTINATVRDCHTGAFRNVVFVVDDVERPLRQIVLAGLKAADAAGYESVSLPAMRLGVMMGAFERSVEATVREMAEGTKAFVDSKPTNIRSITFVVYSDPKALSQLAMLIS